MPEVEGIQENPDQSKARLANFQEMHEVANVLSKAFFTDPVAEFLITSSRRRPKGLKTFFYHQGAYDLLPFGGVYTNDQYSGAALWAPPGKSMLRGFTGLRLLAAMLPHVVGKDMNRSFKFLSKFESIHPKEPHWYLATLGTDPAEQGKGIGGSVIAPVLKQCDRLGLRAYLESSKESNVPFYERHGFKVTKEFSAYGSPILYLMWRDPDAERVRG